MQPYVPPPEEIDDIPVQKQKYIGLKDHDIPIKVLFTGYLCTVGIGYLFALIQILFTHVKNHQWLNPQLIDIPHLHK